MQITSSHPYRASSFTEQEQYFLYLKNLADYSNNSQASLEVGLMYSKGQGVEKDPLQAVEYLKLAANMENREAQYVLGIWYTKGLCVEKNLKEGFKHLKAAADQGHGEAQLHVGIAYGEGSGAPKNLKESFRYYQEGANNHSVIAQHIASVMLEYGQGVEKDLRRALEGYHKAALFGLRESESAMGCMYERGALIQDFAKSASFYNLAAEKNDLNAIESLSKNKNLRILK